MNQLAMPTFAASRRLVQVKRRYEPESRLQVDPNIQPDLALNGPP